MQQVFNHPIIEAGAKGSVEMKRRLQACRADIFMKIISIDMPAAYPAKWRQITRYILPALDTEEFLYIVSVFNAIFASEAYFRINGFFESLYKPAQHRHMIAMKDRFVKIIASALILTYNMTSL